MEGGGTELDRCARRVASRGDERIHWDGCPVCEMDCLSGEVVDVLPAQLDLSRTDERIEIPRVVVGP